MIDTLISASLVNSDISFLEKLPRLILSPAEQKAVQWIISYTKKYGHPPTTDRFLESSHSIFYATHLITSPLADLYEIVIEEKKKTHLLSQIRQWETVIEEEGRLPLNEIMETTREIKSVSVDEHESIFDIDRDSIYSSELPEGMRFGIDAIDNLTGGLLNGEYGLVVARTGVGKTMILCKLSVKWLQEGKRILFISCEMPPAALIGRIDAMVGSFNPRLLRTKFDIDLLMAKKEEVKKKMTAIRAGGGDIIFPKNRRITPSSLLGLIRQHKPQVVIVDGIYLMRTDDGGVSGDWQKIKTISNELKQLSIEENLPILGTSQLKRTGKSIGDDFTLEDIAYSDALAQDPDLVLVAHKNSKMTDEIVVEVMKNRNGEGLGGSMLKFDWNRMRVDEVKWERSAKSDKEESDETD